MVYKPLMIERLLFAAMTTWSIPAAPAETEVEIRRSRFLGFACPVNDREDIQTIRNRLRQQHPHARHYCWAAVIGAPQTPDIMLFDDDGEPQGTAGRPILNVIQQRQVGNILIVVVRYFGGIKLGAGGLVRAYTQAASRVMDHLSLTEWQPRTLLTLELEYGAEAALRQLLSRYEAVLIERTPMGSKVRMRISLPDTEASKMKEACRTLNCALITEEG